MKQPNETREQWKKRCLKELDKSRKIIDSRAFLEENGFYVFRDDEFIDFVTEITCRINKVAYEIINTAYENAKIKNRTNMCFYSDYGEHLLKK